MSERLWKILEEKKEKQYEDFVFALRHCGRFLLNASDDEIDDILDDFGLMMWALEDGNLELYLTEGWINEDIYRKCRRLRKRYKDVRNGKPDTWNYQAVRGSELWRKVIELSEEIQSMLYYIDRKFCV